MYNRSFKITLRCTLCCKHRPPEKAPHNWRKFNSSRKYSYIYNYKLRVKHVAYIPLSDNVSRRISDTADNLNVPVIGKIRNNCQSDVSDD
jgi:hypothetical protein